MSETRNIAVTVNGKRHEATVPVRVREVEAALVGNVPTPDLMRQACESCRAIEAIEDIHAPASYRQHLAAVLSRRALEKAVPRIGQPLAAKLH